MAEPTEGPTLRADGSGQRVRLQPVTTFGRSSRCVVQLDDGSVSGVHAQLAWRDGRWWVRDLASTNGTRLDGHPLPAGEDAPLGEGSCLEFGLDGGVWRLIDGRGPGADTARDVDGTLLTRTSQRAPALSEVRLAFHVSSDEEHARWALVHETGSTDLGDRSYVYLLVTLARERLADAERGLSALDRGWMEADPLAARLGTTPETLKVHVYRARKALRDEGILGAGGLVERRAASNQIRLGTDAVTVEVG